MKQQNKLKGKNIQKILMTAQRLILNETFQTFLQFLVILPLYETFKFKTSCLSIFSAVVMAWKEYCAEYWLNNSSRAWIGALAAAI